VKYAQHLADEVPEECKAPLRQILPDSVTAHTQHQQFTVYTSSVRFHVPHV